MDFASSHLNNELKILLSGQLTFSDAQKFKQVLELATQDGMRAVTLDFLNVTFIDSAGLGMLLLLRDQCQNKHIPVSIAGAQGQVEKIFMISKFDQLFSIHN